MAALGRALANKRIAWVVVVLSLALSAVMGRFALGVGQDDDLLAFLPAGDADIVRFHEIDDRFGGTSVALVAIPADDPFDRAFLETLRALTKALNDEVVIAHAMSLANVEDVRPSPEGGIVTTYLVEPLPTSDAEEAALRERVMRMDHIVGDLVDEEASAVILYNFLARGADPRQAAGLIQEKVRAAFPDRELYWGGAPFISTYIYDTTQADMRRLIPWAVVAVVLIIVLSFRDVFGAMLALVSTGMGIAIAYGLMGMFGVDANIVLSATPVILFAVGSAYAIHVLVRYYALRRTRDCGAAIEATLTQIGPTVAAAGLTTIAGLMSFLAMDIGPMRQFGLYTGLGILATLTLSLTFVPAVVRVAELRARVLAKSVFRDGLVRAFRGVIASRRAVLGGLVVVAAAGALLVGRVEARMESAAFFAPESTPAVAERFLSDRFGGSTFLQVMVEGDMNDPGVLREVQRLADRIAREPHVSDVNHIGEVLAIVHEAMVGERRIPPSTALVRNFYRILAGRAALRQLLTEDRKRALIIAKIDTDAHAVVDPLLARIEAIAQDGVLARYRVVGRLAASEQGDAAEDVEVAVADADRPALAARRRELVLERLLAIFHLYGVSIGEAERARLAASLDEEAAPVDGAAVVGRMVTFLRSDESILDDEDLAEPIAAAVVKIGQDPAREALVAAVGAVLAAQAEDAALDEAAGGADSAARQGEDASREAGAGGAEAADRAAPTIDDELVADLVQSLAQPLTEAWRGVRSASRAQAVLAAVGAETDGARGTDLKKRVADALTDLGRPSAILAVEGDGDGTIAAAVSGTPVIYRGLSRSVTKNQLQSLGVAFALVLVIMIMLFRSVTAGLIAAAPTAFTLVVVYGTMGALGVSLDIGTSMLASIIIGAGVDYAVHLLAAWEGADLTGAAERAGADAGPAIWTNALMVAAGFFVLTLGDAKPLQNVGLLTAAAMITAGLATFLLIPALARRTRYGKQVAP